MRIVLTVGFFKVLERGVVDVDVFIHSVSVHHPVVDFWMSESLVKLRVEDDRSFTFRVGEEVFLPKLKVLCMEKVGFNDETGGEFVRLISSCPLLEELVMVKVSWDSCYVSNSSLKRVIIRNSCNKRVTSGGREEEIPNPMSVSFDTPIVVYLEFTDFVADEYPKVNFDSLVEARVDIRMTTDQISRAKLPEDGLDEPEEDMEMVFGDATDFFMGITNVKTLYLSHNTLQVLAFCCKPIPVYNNLTHLTIQTDLEVEWESLTALLNNCPNLETIVFEGLYHQAGKKCGTRECLCKPREEEDKGIPSCLSSSPVKVLMILKFKGRCEDEDIDKMMDQVVYFLETMPNLEQLIIHYKTSIDEDVEKVLRRFVMVPREGLTKCKIQVISDNLNLSSTLSL